MTTTRGGGGFARTLQCIFAERDLDRARLEGRHRAFGRFEADACGELWTADGWDGPVVDELGGRHAQLFSFLDDRSRLIAHGAFYAHVCEWSFQRCLREALSAIPGAPHNHALFPARQAGSHSTATPAQTVTDRDKS